MVTRTRDASDSDWLERGLGLVPVTGTRNQVHVPCKILLDEMIMC